MKTIEEIIAHNVSSLRQAAGLSQGELAQKAKVSLHTVFRIENRKPNPRISSVIAIAKALGVSKDDLYTKPATLKDFGISESIQRPPASLTPEEIKTAVRDAFATGKEIEQLRAEIDALKARLPKAGSELAKLLDEAKKLGDDNHESIRFAFGTLTAEDYVPFDELGDSSVEVSERNALQPPARPEQLKKRR